MPVPASAAQNARTGADTTERKSGGAEAILRGRLGALARLARDDTMLLAVKFCHESIDDDWCVSTAQALEMNTHLDSLILVGNGITDASGPRIARATGKHPALATVALGGNALGDATALGFGAALRESTTLLALNLASTKYHYEHFRAKVRRRYGGLSALAYLRKIKEETRAKERALVAAPTDTPPVSRPATAKILEAHAAIEAVRALDEDLPKTYDGLEGFNPIGWGAPSDDPRYNARAAAITKRGCFGIADGLAGSSLTSLNLGGQAVGDAGALALARVLFADERTTCSCDLRHLAVDANGILDDGAVSLADVPRGNALFATSRLMLGASRGMYQHTRTRRRKSPPQQGLRLAESRSGARRSTAGRTRGPL